MVRVNISYSLNFYVLLSYKYMFIWKKKVIKWEYKDKKKTIWSHLH